MLQLNIIVPALDRAACIPLQNLLSPFDLHFIDRELQLHMRFCEQSSIPHEASDQVLQHQTLTFAMHNFPALVYRMFAVDSLTLRKTSSFLALHSSHGTCIVQ